jgi:hypothetical protein
MPAFVPGIALSRAFYLEAVRPILDSHLPGLVHSAALIGYGSDVLGYDDSRSTDHQWGPRLLLFLAENDHARHAAAIQATLAAELPFSFRGYPTHFAPPDAEGTRLLAARAERPIDHLVELHEPRNWFSNWIGFYPLDQLTTRDWLLTPAQKLLEVTAGDVFHDDLGVLAPIREKLRWYPRDVWRYLVACGWQRIGQEEAFVGRCAEVGDELGSRIVAARLVRDLMRLCFLFEQRYPPYSKWFGTAFARLNCTPALQPALMAALGAGDFPAREAALSRAYEAIAALHNATGLTAPLDPAVRDFYGRPFKVIFAQRFVEAALAAIPPGAMQDIATSARAIGSVDQFIDSTDVLSHGTLPRRAEPFYDAPIGGRHALPAHPLPRKLP